MGYSKDVYEEADKIIRERRNQALREADVRKRKFFKNYPEAEKLEQELSSTLSKVTKAMVRGTTDLKTALEKLREENLHTQEKLKGFYNSAGISENDLEPKFTCKACEDKGNIDGRMCSCYRQLLKETACDKLNKLSPFKLSTFDTFSLDYYSDKKSSGESISERERIQKYFEYCKKYAKSFCSKSKNILMRGNTGLGKTHLSLAIAKSVTEKGYGVVYCSTPEIISEIEKEHFGKSTDNGTLEMLKECDLIVLDDLGTEFHTSFTKTTAYNLINSRLIHRKPTIISTNLELEELEELYSRRLVSRLMGEYVIMNFAGTDIRQIKRLQKYK